MEVQQPGVNRDVWYVFFCTEAEHALNMKPDSLTSLLLNIAAKHSIIGVCPEYTATDFKWMLPFNIRIPWYTEHRSWLKDLVGVLVLCGESGNLTQAEKTAVTHIAKVDVPIFIVDGNDYCLFEGGKCIRHTTKELGTWCHCFGHTDLSIAIMAAFKEGQ